MYQSTNDMLMLKEAILQIKYASKDTGTSKARTLPNVVEIRYEITDAADNSGVARKDCVLTHNK